MKGVRFNYDKIVKVACKAFDLINGWINPILPASDIEFDCENLALPIPSDKQGDFNALIAHTLGTKLWFNPNAVILFQRYVYEAWDHSHLGEMYVKGMIIEIIAHELSHLDQDIDQYKFDIDEKYRNVIEAANELHTKTWLRDNYCELEKKLGGFDILEEWCYNRIYQATLDEYKTITNPLGKLMSVLNSFFQVDMSGLINEVKDSYDVIHIFVNDAKQGKIAVINIDELLSSEAMVRKTFKFIDEQVCNSLYKGTYTGVYLLDKEKVIELYVEFDYTKTSGPRMIYPYASDDKIVKKYELGK